MQRFANGEKKRYFEDDDMHSTAALAKSAKLGVHLHDMDEAMARNIVSRRRFRAQELDVDDEYDHDGGLELSEQCGTALPFEVVSLYLRRFICDSGQWANVMAYVSRNRPKHGGHCRKLGKTGKLRSSAQHPLQAPSDLIQNQCRQCFMSAKRNIGLTVSVGMHVYMAMPERGCLVPGHVCIMPVEHTPSFRAADDDVYEELKNFQKCLMQMCEAEV